MTDNDQERARVYLADLLGVSPAELEETLNAGRWPEYRRPFAEAVRQLEQAERLHRGPRADMVLRDDVVSDHATPPAMDTAGRYVWWMSLRAQQPALQLVPANLLPGRDQIRYATEVVEHMRAVFGPWWPAERPMTVGRRRGSVTSVVVTESAYPGGQNLEHLRGLERRRVVAPWMQG